MKTSSVTFAQLRRLLLDLEFSETRGETFWRFDHPASGAIFLFPPYVPSDRISMADLASTRRHLDWRGLLSSHAFDDSLAKTPA